MVTPAQTAPVTAAPAEPVPVAVYCRTSTLGLQDPVASRPPPAPLLPGLATPRAGSSPPCSPTWNRAAPTWRRAARVTAGGY